MPSVKGNDAIIRDTECLLDAVESNPTVKEEIEKERQLLMQSVGEVKTLKARQTELTAQRQEATQQLNVAVSRLRDTAMAFRAMVKAKLGFRNERLVQFKISPLRKRTRRGLEKKKKLPPDGDVVRHEPVVSAVPSAPSVGVVA